MIFGVSLLIALFAGVPLSGAPVIAAWGAVVGGPFFGGLIVLTKVMARFETELPGIVFVQVPMRGVQVVPLTAGILTKGNVLVAEFDNSAATPAGGTTILQVNPATGATSVFYSGAPVAGPVGIAINPANDGVWIGDYGSAQDGTAANDLLISAAGTLAATFTDASTSHQASFVGVWGQGMSLAGGVVSFYWGNAGNATTGSGGGDVWRLTPHPKGPVNGQPVNSTYAQIAAGRAETPAGGSAASAAGPQGFAYDSSSGVLYETNDASNTLYAIPSAATTTATVTPAVVYQGPALDSPENLVIDPPMATSWW